MDKFTYIIVTVIAVLTMSFVTGQAQEFHGGDSSRGGRSAGSSSRGGSVIRSIGGGCYYGGRYGGRSGAAPGQGLWGFGYPYYPAYAAPIVVDQLSANMYIQPELQQADLQQDPQQMDPQRVDPQQLTVPSHQAQTNFWYYCQNPQGYYPYVKQCLTEWMKLVPTPPPSDQ